MHQICIDVGNANIEQSEHCIERFAFCVSNHRRYRNYFPIAFKFNMSGSTALTFYVYIFLTFFFSFSAGTHHRDRTPNMIVLPQCSDFRGYREITSLAQQSWHVKDFKRLRMQCKIQWRETWEMVEAQTILWGHCVRLESTRHPRSPLSNGGSSIVQFTTVTITSISNVHFSARANISGCL